MVSLDITTNAKSSSAATERANGKQRAPLPLGPGESNIVPDPVDTQTDADSESDAESESSFQSQEAYYYDMAANRLPHPQYDGIRYPPHYHSPAYYHPWTGPPGQWWTPPYFPSEMPGHSNAAAYNDPRHMGFTVPMPAYWEMSRRQIEPPHGPSSTPTLPTRAPGGSLPWDDAPARRTRKLTRTDLKMLKKAKASYRKTPYYPSAFILFKTFLGPYLRDEATYNIKYDNIAKIVSRMWHEFSDDEKAPWLAKSEQRKRELIAQPGAPPPKQAIPPDVCPFDVVPIDVVVEAFAIEARASVDQENLDPHLDQKRGRQIHDSELNAMWYLEERERLWEILQKRLGRKIPLPPAFTAKHQHLTKKDLSAWM